MSDLAKELYARNFRFEASSSFKYVALDLGGSVHAFVKKPVLLPDAGIYVSDVPPYETKTLVEKIPTYEDISGAVLSRKEYSDYIALQKLSSRSMEFLKESLPQMIDFSRIKRASIRRKLVLDFPFYFIACSMSLPRGTGHTTSIIDYIKQRPAINGLMMVEDLEDAREIGRTHRIKTTTPHLGSKTPKDESVLLVDGYLTGPNEYRTDVREYVRLYINNISAVVLVG